MRRSLPLALLLGACTSPEEEPTHPADEIRVELSERVATVATLTWETTTAASVTVEYGPTAAYGTFSPATPAGTAHAVTLLGLPADTVVHYRVVTDYGGDDVVVGPDATFETGALPAGLPGLDVSAEDDGVSPAFTLFPWYAPEEGSWIYVVDAAGRVVWYAEADGQVLNTAFSADGRAILALLSVETDEASSRIVRFPLDGGEPTSLPAPYAHHAFVELPGGEGYGYIASVTQEIAGESLKGDRIVEVDLDGREREVWNAFDHVPVVENDGWIFDLPDWTHANGMAYDAAHERYVLSLYRQEQVYAIARNTGMTEWILGAGGDFDFPDDIGFGPQHSPVLTERGVLLFDNADTSDAARLVEYALDEQSFVATRVWEQSAPDGEHTRIMGSGVRVPGGALSSWGEIGQVFTIDDAGVVRRGIKPDEVGVTGIVSARLSLYAE